MAVAIKIHRGTDQIGGTITEIFTDNTHFFIDFGAELSVSEEGSTDADMVKMIRNSKCDAVLFTHHHGDHFGLFGEIPDNAKLGLGETARGLMCNIYETLSGKKDTEENRQEAKRHLDILRDNDRWIDICDKKAFSVGDFTITPIRVDHSAYDAFMFVIEAEEKCIVHTGDFRTHGRLGKDTFKRLSEYFNGRSVDMLITEGTMMNRLSEKVMTEDEMEKKALEILKDNKYAFLICSSTNLETLAGFHYAALKCGRPLIVNRYDKQLLLYRETAGKENRKMEFRKAYPFENMYVTNPKLDGGMTQPEYMKKRGFVMLAGASDSYTKRMEYFRNEDPLLIYSMWGGYLDKDNPAFDQKLFDLYSKWRHIRLHTSGHARREDLEDMIKCVKPSRAIIPVHTERKERFFELDINGFADLVKPLSDGEDYIL